MEIGQKIVVLLKATIVGFFHSNGTILAAALAFYATFSLAPLLMIGVIVAGLAFGEAAVQGAIVDQISYLVGNEVASTIQLAIESIYLEPSADIATIFSLVVIVVGASILFVQLKRSINHLWGIAPHPGKGLLFFIQTQLISFVMVLLFGLLLLAGMALSTFLLFIDQLIKTLPLAVQPAVPGVNFGIIFIFFTLVFAALFKILPDAHITWHDVLPGAAVTSLLFTIGEFLIGYYLGWANITSFSSAASSVILILIWVYFSMQIVLVGAKFTQVYADQFGSRIIPTKNSVLIVHELINTYDDEVGLQKN